MQGTGEPAIARVAAAQEAIIARGQLRLAGFGRGAIDYRVAQGKLQIVYPGVYLVGHAVLSPLARQIAALLALGSDAVLSHRSAARIWELIPSPQNSAAGELEEEEATVVGRGARGAGRAAGRGSPFTGSLRSICAICGSTTACP